MIFNPNVMAAASGGGAEIIKWTGDGTGAREISLPFSSALLIVMSTANSSRYVSFVSEKHCFVIKTKFMANANLSETSESGMFSLNKSVIDAKLSITTNTYLYLNSQNIPYICIAFPKA